MKKKQHDPSSHIKERRTNQHIVTHSRSQARQPADQRLSPSAHDDHPCTPPTFAFHTVDLQPGVPVCGDIRRAWLDVVAVLATHVARGVVVANSEVRRDIATDTDQASSSAVLGVATDGGGISPDDLREVAITALALFERHKQERTHPQCSKFVKLGLSKPYWPAYQLTSPL